MIPASLLEKQLSEERAARLRAERERDEARFRPMGDNHHNAASCPYCGDPLRAAQKRIEGLEAALRLCIAWMPLAEVHSWPPGFRLRKEALAAATAALSSPAVTAEGKKLGEGRGEHRPECASLEYVAETNGVTALDCNCGFAAGVPWLDSDRVLAHELLEALDDEPNHEVEVVISYLARARAAPPKTSEGA